MRGHDVFGTLLLSEVLGPTRAETKNLQRWKSEATVRRLWYKRLGSKNEKAVNNDGTVTSWAGLLLRTSSNRVPIRPNLG